MASVSQVMQDFQTFPREAPDAIAAREKAQAAEEKQAKAEQAAATKAAKARNTAEPKVQAAPPADSADRELKLLKIRLYFQKLGAKLPFKEPKTYPKSDADIDELLNAIETSLHSSGGVENAAFLFQTGCVEFERLTSMYNPLNLQLSGPHCRLGATVMANRQEWEELVTEFAICNAGWFMAGPGKRLLLFTLQMVQTVDAANKAALLGARPVPKDKMEAVKDL